MDSVPATSGATARRRTPPERLALLGPPLDAELAAHQAGRDVGGEVKAALKRLLGGRRPAMRDVWRGHWASAAARCNAA